MHRKTLFSLFLVAVILITTVSSVHSSQNKANPLNRVLEAGLSSKVLKEDETFFFEDGRSPALFVLTREGNTLINSNTPSFPFISPNQERMAYISPFSWEEIGELFIYDSTEGNPRKILTTSDLPANTTPKSIHWLDERFLMAIIGQAYGTTSVGGDVYIIDTNTGLFEIFYQGEDHQEVQNIKVFNQDIVFELANFNDNYTDYEIKSISASPTKLLEITNKLSTDLN